MAYLISSIYTYAGYLYIDSQIQVSYKALGAWEQCSDVFKNSHGKSDNLAMGIKIMMLLWILNAVKIIILSHYTNL